MENQESGWRRDGVVCNTLIDYKRPIITCEHSITDLKRLNSLGETRLRVFLVLN